VRTVVKFGWLMGAFLLVLLPMFAYAQNQTTGGISGTIRDTQGAVIVSAGIQIREHEQRRQKHSAIASWHF
jgi:hypothetical protein